MWVKKREKQRMKYGFDIHGVIDDLEEEIRPIMQALYSAGHEVHIITGSQLTKALRKQLSDLEVPYTELHSISDYHKNKGTEGFTYVNPITGEYDENNPWLPAEIWDRTKAELCAEIGIAVMFDDSDVYHKFFTTPYARVFSKR